MIIAQQKSPKILAMRDGYLICPVCRRNKKLQRIDESMSGKSWPVYCRSCKNEIKIDVVDGQCFESRS